MTTLSKESHYYDNTMIANYKECPRKYFLRHVMEWTTDSEKKAPALVFGSAWHAGMDAIWGNNKHDRRRMFDQACIAFDKQWEEDGYTVDMSLEEAADLKARTPGIAHEMFHHYIAAREKMLAETEVIAIEQPIAMPYPNMHDTWYVGKLDKVVRYNGIHILEHKTTTAYAIKGMFQPNYLESWNASSQVKGYQVVGSTYHEGLQDVWVDCALVHAKVHDAFKFVPIAHSWPLLKEWIVDTGRWIEAIQNETIEWLKMGSLEKGTFRKNEDSCYGKYGTCPFLNICSTCSDPTQLDEVPSLYKKEAWEPFDTLKLDNLIHKPDAKGE